MDIEVTAGIITESNRILIARRGEGKARAGKWELPGGKVEPDEKPEDCLKRELLEEFGIHVTVGDLYMITHHSYPDVDISLLAYRVIDYKGTISLNEHQQVKWISVKDHIHYDFAAADRPVLKKLSGELD